MMNAVRSTVQVVVILSAMVLLIPGAALAYGGPGSVVSGIGALLAALAAIVAAIFGFLWFPLKRLLKTLRSEGEESGVAGD